MPVLKPSKMNQCREGIRSIVELRSFMLNRHKIVRKEKISSEVCPVIVVPGFLATDKSTARLRDVLSRLGVDVRGWGQGRNLGFRSGFVSGLVDLINKVNEDTGKKVILIGHSLGGVYAKEIAKAHPDLISQIITLGTPLIDDDEDYSNVGWLYELFNPKESHALEQIISHDLEGGFGALPSCAVTSIYSKSDGIVHSNASVLPERDGFSNIEVDCSHLGLVVYVPVVDKVIDILRQSANG
jgi:pimeloyl-ACP methyl ester carboxylesterase